MTINRETGQLLFALRSESCFFCLFFFVFCRHLSPDTGKCSRRTHVASTILVLPADRSKKKHATRPFHGLFLYCFVFLPAELSISDRLFVFSPPAPSAHDQDPQDAPPHCAALYIVSLRLHNFLSPSLHLHARYSHVCAAVTHPRPS